MSAPYADFHVVAMPRRVLPRYRKTVVAAGKIVRKHGAIAYREFVGDDLASKWATLRFPACVKAKRGETVVAAIVGSAPAPTATAR